MVDVADVGHQVRNIPARVGHLLVNIVISKDGVDLAQDTGAVGVDENDADAVLVGGDGAEGDLGNVDGTESGTLVDVTDERVGDFKTNGTLGLYLEGIIVSHSYKS